MQLKDVKKAEAEAKRFLERVNELKEATKGFMRSHWDSKQEKHIPGKMFDSDYFYGSKESAALKRASMDLTRALAKLRSPC